MFAYRETSVRKFYFPNYQVNIQWLRAYLLNEGKRQNIVREAKCKHIQQAKQQSRKYATNSKLLGF